MAPKRGLLIAGASHTGKSTLAQAIATDLSWPVHSTDEMSRHPGRPWPDPPAHVAAFYDGLSAEVIETLVRHHHINMWPLHRQWIEIQTSFIFEGTALRPELIAPLRDDVEIVVLVAPEGALHARIKRAAGTSTTLVDAFADRAERENRIFYENATDHNLRIIDAAAVAAFHHDFVMRQSR